MTDISVITETSKYRLFLHVATTLDRLWAI